MHPVLEEISNIGIVPVIKIDDVEKAVPLARALEAGEIPCAEVTFRTAQGEEAIRRIAKEVPGVLVGAGTVLTTEQVDRAVEAGARYVVSPGFNPKVVAHCAKRDMPITPGCSCPSDMEQAIAASVEVVKFFPAEQAGGLAYIKAVAAPYSGLRFLPTGGINAANLVSYLSFDKVVACGGSWMVPPALISQGRFDEIAGLCREAVNAMLALEVVHVGINAQNETEALAAARRFEALFSFAVKDGNSSVFAGSGIEICKTPFKGKHGHIAVGTNSVVRALAHLERRGFAADPASAKSDAQGKLKAIYLSEEIAGFALHLVQKQP